MKKPARRKASIRVLALSLLAVSGGAIASLEPVRMAGQHTFTTANSGWGKAVTVGPDGSVYAAGECFGVATYDVYVARLNAATLAQEWGIVSDMGDENRVTGIVADTAQVYVCGRGNAALNDGFVGAFGTGSGSLAWNKGAVLNEGFYGVALDSVAGEVLAVGSTGSDGYLARFTTSGAVLAARQFKHSSYTSVGRAVAVAGERIFVGGYAVNGSDYPWVYCMDRISGQKVWSVMLADDAAKTVTSMAVVGDYIYALVVGECGDNGKLVIIDSVGEEVRRAVLYTGANCASCPASIRPPPQQVVAHPTLPILFVVAGYQRNTLMALDLDLNVLWTQPAIVPVEGASTMEWISGVAVSPGFNSAVYVVGQQMVTGPIYKMKTGGFTLGNPAIAEEKLVVAPNRLELSGKIREVSIIVRDDAGKELTVRIFDTAGLLVRTITGTVGAAGVFEARWDGTGGTGGGLLAPGIYLVRVDGQKSIKPVMLTTEAK